MHTMNLPDTFPDGTSFLDVDGVPVTRHPRQAGCLAWDEPDARGPRWFPVDAAARCGQPISEAAFVELYMRNVNRASPARLLAAAIDLNKLRDACADRLRAQGLSAAEMAAVFRCNRAANRALEAERQAIRAIGAAMRPQETQ
jgi:hypothetical protein